MKNKIWLKSYPPGVPSTINLDKYSTLSEAILTYCGQFKNNVAFSGLGGDLTYEELAEQARQLGAVWQSHGLKKGDAIALILPNILQYPVAFLAAIRIGLVVVNVNPMYTQRELTHQLQDAAVKAVVVLDIFSQALIASSPDLALEHVYITSVGDYMPSPFRGCVNMISRFKKPFRLKNIPKSVQVHSLLACIKQGKKKTLKPVVLLADDLLLLQYTSATTGEAKGAMITNRNILANIAQCLTWMRSEVKVGSEVVLAALPLYHIFSLTVCGLCFLAVGARVQLVADPRNIKKMIKMLHKTPISVFVGLNTLFQALLGQSNFAYANFSQLKMTVAGGMPTMLSVAKKWKKTTGSVILEGYGLTEASPVVAINPVSTERFVGSVGLPIPNTDIKIADANGLSLAPGKVGELFVKGPQVMKGYWNKPEETAAILDDDGWLKTGDMARMDDQGFITIVDRKKDMVLVSGFNVYPNEIEDVLNDHDNIVEASVIGVPDSKTGEAVIAFVVTKGKLTPPAVKEYCRIQLAAYKIPKEVVIVKGLPKSNVGKVLRRVLKDQYEAK